MLRRSLLLFMLIASMQKINFGDTSVIPMEGLVGDAVSMPCLFDPSSARQIKRVYFQKKPKAGEKSDGEIFVNGFDSKRSIEKQMREPYKSRTRFHRFNYSLEFLDLHLTDEGEYKCIMFDETINSNMTEFHLSITANYRVPKISLQQCDHSDPSGPTSCTISCTSSGGYPESSVSWQVSGTQKSQLMEGRNVSLQDRSSRLWNVSQTATLNCSQPANISCSVGGAVSHPLSICVLDELGREDLTVIWACVIVLAIVLIIVFVLVQKVYRRTHHHDPVPDAEAVQLNNSPG